MECVEKIIKKDMIDPTNGKKITDKDIITLQRVCSQYSYTKKSIKKGIIMADFKKNHVIHSTSSQSCSMQYSETLQWQAIFTLLTTTGLN